MTENISTQSLLPLPLDNTNFADLRKKGQIYVDKSQLVYELAKEDKKVLLLRPEGFGKSLLVSTLYSLFQFGLRDFSDLAIEALWQDKNSYSVIHLDLAEVSRFKDGGEFKKSFEVYLMSYMRSHGMHPDELRITENGMEVFSGWLSRQDNSSVVMLIDNYDSPFVTTLDSLETLRSVETILATFFSYLKGSSKVFRFLFLTGVTKFGNSAIASALNNLEDITWMEDFGEIAGFTQDELKHYFQGYLIQSTEALNLPEPRLLQKLVANYGGFCFEEKGTKKVLAPSSILSFFKSPQSGFENYWGERAAKASILQEYIKDQSQKQPPDFLKSKTMELSAISPTLPIDKMDLKTLLLQTGYLTIQGRKDQTLSVGFPNLEVADSMVSLFFS